MKIFGYELTFQKTIAGLQTVYANAGGWLGGMILEPFAGAWQRNIVAESRANILAFSTAYRCVSLIAGDISKLRMKLMQQDDNGIWSEVLDLSPFKSVLVRPNDYQTVVQFLNQWFVSKLLYGNTYCYIVRDQRGIATSLYILDPRQVKLSVTPDGTLYYELATDNLSGIQGPLLVPASNIMHDRCVCLFHPLIGVSPIYACAASATQGIRIQAQSANFFENMSRPSLFLTSPDKISDETAKRLKAVTEQAVSGGNIGRILVGGDGLKVEPMTMPATDAQLIEQLQWTARDVAAAFGVPLHKVGAGEDQKFANLAALNQDYYAQTLQEYIEAIEALYNDKIGVGNVSGKTYAVELDLEGLLRMDPISRADRYAKLIGAAVMAPNEARAAENMKPAEGGDSPMIQQQNYSLAALARRDAQPDPFATAAPKPAALPAPPEPPADSSAKAAMAIFAARIKQKMAA